MMEDYPKMMGMVMKEGRMPRNENEVAINEHTANGCIGEQSY